MMTTCAMRDKAAKTTAELEAKEKMKTKSDMFWIYYYFFLLIILFYSTFMSKFVVSFIYFFGSEKIHF
ncbi:unnamed protein product [Trifolium pratense]|uniref:Uncharacterized protein n=1 Tax=Trifolium pratense TaxID=57577 RepID=A0ACB0JR91_TRIPR|nr:unnamed protein product [Trifolium pratense]